MPQSTHMNGYTNGHANGLYEMEDQQIFLFTSESVGEGHPGKCSYTLSFFIHIANQLEPK